MNRFVTHVATALLCTLVLAACNKPADSGSSASTADPTAVSSTITNAAQSDKAFEQQVALETIKNNQETNIKKIDAQTAKDSKTSDDLLAANSADANAKVEEIRGKYQVKSVQAGHESVFSKVATAAVPVAIQSYAAITSASAEREVAKEEREDRLARDDKYDKERNIQNSISRATTSGEQAIAKREAAWKLEHDKFQAAINAASAQTKLNSDIASLKTTTKDSDEWGRLQTDINAQNTNLATAHRQMEGDTRLKAMEAKMVQDGSFEDADAALTKVDGAYNATVAGAKETLGTIESATTDQQVTTLKQQALQAVPDVAKLKESTFQALGSVAPTPPAVKSQAQLDAEATAAKATPPGVSDADKKAEAATKEQERLAGLQQQFLCAQKYLGTEAGDRSGSKDCGLTGVKDDANKDILAVDLINSYFTDIRDYGALAKEQATTTDDAKKAEIKTKLSALAVRMSGYQASLEKLRGAANAIPSADLVTGISRTEGIFHELQAMINNGKVDEANAHIGKDFVTFYANNAGYQEGQYIGGTTPAPVGTVTPPAPDSTKYVASLVPKPTTAAWAPPDTSSGGTGARQPAGFKYVWSQANQAKWNTEHGRPANYYDPE